MSIKFAIPLSFILAVVPVSIGINAAAADPNATTPERKQARVDAVWGDERRIYDVLLAEGPELSNREGRRVYMRGDLIPNDVSLAKLPDNLLPDSSPAAGLDLRFFRAQQDVVVVLHDPRVVVKVYRPDGFEARQPTTAASDPPQTIPEPAPGRAAAPPALAETQAQGKAIQETAPEADSRQDSDTSKRMALGPATVAAAPAPKPSASSPDPAILVLIARADAQRKRGDILAARLLLERAADLGSREAMRRLAETYDANVLSAWGAIGVKPNPARASALYEQSKREGETTIAKTHAR